MGSCGMGFGGLAGRGELGCEDEGRGRIQVPPSRESLTPALALLLLSRPVGLVSARGLLTRNLQMF